MDDDFLQEDEMMELHIKKLIEDKEKQISQFFEDIPDDLWSDEDVCCEMLEDRDLANDYPMLKDYKLSEDSDDDDIESLYVELFGEEDEEDEEDEDLFFYEIYGSYIPPNHHYF